MNAITWREVVAKIKEHVDAWGQEWPERGKELARQMYDVAELAISMVESETPPAKPKYPDLGPFLSLCHERQYDIGCKHGERESIYRCRQCMSEVGDELASRKPLSSGPNDERSAIIEECAKALGERLDSLRTMADRVGYTREGSDLSQRASATWDAINIVRALKNAAPQEHDATR